MTLGVFSNNYIPREKYAIKENNQFGNTDSEGHSSFLEEFVQDEATEKRLKAALEREEKQVEDIPVQSYSTPSQYAISDYIDNFLLINAEQVACTNMTQHLIKSDELKETLGFLNTQAAKTMFKSKKKPNYADHSYTSPFKNSMMPQQKSPNFFTIGLNTETTNSSNNFFMK